jgi:DNA-binding transcriptional MerR regulator
LRRPPVGIRGDGCEVNVDNPAAGLLSARERRPPHLAGGGWAVEKAPEAFRTISEVAEELELPQHVLRFWETRFAQIKPMKRGGGRRYYRPDDVDLLRGIRHLLYGEGYTIRGVQRLLKDEGVRFVQGVWKTGASRLAGQKSAEGDDADDFEDDDEEPSRALLGLWPSLLGGIDGPGGGESARIEPSIGGPEAAESAAVAVASGERSGPRPGSTASGAPAAGAAPVRGLPSDAVAKLQAVLLELTECRRLIDAAETGET